MSFFAAKRGPRGARLHTAALYNPSGVSTGPSAVLRKLTTAVQRQKSEGGPKTKVGRGAHTSP